MRGSLGLKGFRGAQWPKGALGTLGLLGWGGGVGGGGGGCGGAEMQDSRFIAWLMPLSMNLSQLASMTYGPGAFLLQC